MVQYVLRNASGLGNLCHNEYVSNCNNCNNCNNWQIEKHAVMAIFLYLLQTLS